LTGPAAQTGSSSEDRPAALTPLYSSLSMAPTAGMRGSVKQQGKTGTNALLDKMMADAKIPAAQQRHLRAVAEGKRPPHVPVAPAAARAARGGPSRPYEDRYAGIALNPSLVPRGIKLREEIVAETRGYQRDMYRATYDGRPNTTDQKAMLQDSYFGPAADRGAAPAGRGARAVSRSAHTAPPPPRAKSEAARLHEAIAEEIIERQEFLEEMRVAGRAQEIEGKLRREIAERMQELRRVEELMQDEAA